MPRTTKANHTEASLRNLAAQMKENAVLLEAGADALKLLGLSTLTVNAADSAKRGMQGMDAFVREMREAIREAGTADKKRVRRPDTGAEK